MDRFLSSEEQDQEQEHHIEQRSFDKDASLRPKDFSEYIGQEKVIENISIMVESAKKREKAMDHVLLSGPPGLGKTSLAMILSHALSSELHVISGPALEKKGDLASILTNLAPCDVLFIDEIHRLNIVVEEMLYSAMEDFRLDIVIGQGPTARTLQIDLPPFTLIGATTRSGLLSHPLRDRFMAHLHFDYYKPKELAVMLGLNCDKLEITVDSRAIEMIATCARGTPRIANRILRRVRDFAVVHDSTLISVDAVQRCLNLMEIDVHGLDQMDRKILKVIDEFYQGGPVGIDALCATLSEDRSTIEDVYEPFLLKEGLLIRTPRGRANSPKAQAYLKDLKS
jgi:holliday junction DNA helicase RuvB